MGNGKRGVAPCGHPGEAVIGQYYKCLRGCDSAINWDDITLEIPKCENCGSLDIDEDFELDPMFYFFNPGSPKIDTRCNHCGSCWQRIK
jgi:hypothetical protein